MDRGIFMNTIEMAQIDIRFEGHRLKDKRREGLLLKSIAESGVQEPLQGILIAGRLFLLDGFKRYRCAKKLKIENVPYESFGEDEATAIIKLMKISNAKSLHILEQAKLVDELKNVHNLKVAEIARQLERSIGWVSMRIGLLSEMSKEILEEVFKGKFPAHSVMYTLRQFKRLNKIPLPEVTEFVKAVSGKNLSVRNIDLLAKAFFEGGKETKTQILCGNLEWSMRQLKSIAEEEQSPLNETEKRVHKDLSILNKYMERVIHQITMINNPSIPFRAMAGLQVEGILSRIDLLKKRLNFFQETINDRSRNQNCNQSPAPRGKENQRTVTTVRTR
jgi:hypothetical protein